MSRTPSKILLTLLLALLPEMAFPGSGNIEYCLSGWVKSDNCTNTIRNFYRHEAAITRAARVEGLEPSLLKAMIAVESRYNSDAVSNKGAIGLMQMLPSTGADIGVPSPYYGLRQPDVALAAGARYIAQMWWQFRDWRLALAAYNAGPAAVLRYRGIPPYAETQAYVRDVLHLYSRFKNVENVRGSSPTVVPPEVAKPASDILVVNE